MSALGGIAGVFHTDHDLYQRFRHICRNLIDVGRAQAVAAAHTPAVDPQRGNTGALQRQLHGKSEKIGIEVNGFPKPCLPLKCIGVGQESGLPCRIGGSFFGERGGAGEGNGVIKSRGNLFPCHLRQREFPDTAEVITCDHMFDSFQKGVSIPYPKCSISRIRCQETGVNKLKKIRGLDILAKYVIIMVTGQQKGGSLWIANACYFSTIF